MTLSNFDWTDKTSVKWFIMLPTGHEGPYSLNAFIKRKLSPNVKIWAEGMTQPMELKAVLEKEFSLEMDDVDDELPPPLPPLPDESKEELRSAPLEQEILVPTPFNQKKKLTGLAFGLLILFGFGTTQWVKTQESFSIRRATRMSPALFDQINREFKFEGWGKNIFFKEFVPADMSQIWLVNSGYQDCQIEASFHSLQGKLLAVKDEKVSFKSSGRLKDHLAEFSHFEFTAGNKILPGLYEMDLRASNCKWGPLAARIGNFFSPPQEEYMTRMKIVLYHKGSREFNGILDRLIRKKLDLEVKNQNQEEAFWQDLQQKLQTLIGISLQIEQLLLELVERPPKDFSKNLKATVDLYTQKYGSTLTEFVVQNERYFQKLDQSELSNIYKKRSYESVIRLSSKNVGFDSMKIIEQLQSWKNPTTTDLSRIKLKIKSDFAVIKEGLNHRLIQLTEDRVAN